MKPKSCARVAEVLRAHGWRLVRTVGSHRHYFKDGVAALVTLPFHGRSALVKVGTLKSIARASGIPESDF